MPAPGGSRRGVGGGDTVRLHEALRYLQDMGWTDVEGPLASPAATAGPARADRHDAGSCDDAGAPPQSVSAVDPVQADNLADMADLLRDCRRCRLCGTRTQVVFGVGSPGAQVMLVGEGPGADEDRLGEPFVGRAGQLLNSMLAAVGLDRKEVYIANVVKCRPPGNRNPEVDEARACLPFLRRQAELVNPQVVVTLGRVPALRLLDMPGPISSYRGRWTAWEGRAVLPMFHPAYLLRNPAAKAVAWSDLKELRRRLTGGRNEP